MRDSCGSSYDKLDKYFNIHSDHCVLATLLDARIKLSFYEDEKNPDQSLQNVAEAKRQLENVFQIYQPRWGHAAQPEAADTSDYGPMAKRKRVSAANNEIKLYLDALPFASLKSNPLEWWRSNRETLPILSRMARDYLGIQSSSVASERAFSGARQTCTDNRASLGTGTVRATQCLKSWSKLHE
mgnify:CR=1 FL=1|jgi:hypothetical protein